MEGTIAMQRFAQARPGSRRRRRRTRRRRTAFRFVS